MSLYVAYGSNLNVQQMSYRCPGATVAFTGYLINWKLLYRGSRTGSYATVKRQKGSRVPVAVWNIDSKNEKALDLYEGYPRFYKKRNVFVQLKNGTRKKAMIYLLPDSATAGRPSSRYVGTVLQGYKDCVRNTLKPFVCIHSISQSCAHSKERCALCYWILCSI